MNNINFHMPTEVISGVGAIAKAPEKLIAGTRCTIVTGAHSAKASGALADVAVVLESNGIPYAVFDRATENPYASMCHEGGRFCREFGADFIIAIGGGSPIDSAKAIAAYAVNEWADVMDIYDVRIGEADPLPIIAIPTTAGTGTEVNPYAVLTLEGGTKKKSFKSPKVFPKTAFIDPKYTYSLSSKNTVSCALDAFCHSIEAFMSPKSNGFTEMFSIYGAKAVWDVLVVDGAAVEFTPEQRAKLLYGSSAAGIAITHCGTGFTHPLGYALTMSEGVPHGFACAAFTGEYVRCNMLSPEGAEKLNRFAAAIGATVDAIAERIPTLANVRLKLDGERLAEYALRNKSAGNFANSPYIINESEMLDIYSRLFG